ncbi:hypothetical protein SESI111939_14835 [Serratia silvae]
MVKSLVGLQTTNNIPSLISRCNEGPLYDSQFLTDSWLSFRINPADTHSCFVPISLFCKKEPRPLAARCSRYLSTTKYSMDFKLQLGDKLSHPQELTFVSDWGDKSVGNRFERCTQRPRRGEVQGWAE